MYNIKCFAVFERAFQRMVQILFRPFELSKWFVLGFCAWLAILTEGQTGGFNFNFRGFKPPHPGAPGPVTSRSSAFLKDLFIGDGTFAGKICNYFEIPEYVFWLIVFGAVSVVLLGIAIYLVFAWISCRFKFVFIDNLAKDKTEISRLWFDYKKLGNSAFKWFIVFFGISFLFMVVSFIVIASIFYPIMLDYLRNDIFDMSVGSIVALTVSLTVFFIGILVLSFAYYFFNEFVIPIMYRKNISAGAAYKDFLQLLGVTPLTFLKFWLLQIVANIACGLAVVIFIFCTCCIAIIPMIIPYLGTVVILPVIVFQRLQAMELLYAFGPEYSPYPRPPAPPKAELCEM